VHTSDLTLYLMGDVERVFAETHLWERTIKIARPEQPTELYAHRVREEIEEADTVEATAEDTGLTLMRFSSGAIGQTTFSDAAPGEQSIAHVIYGSEGSLRLPGFRAGRPVQVALAGGLSPVAQKDLMRQVPDFRLDETTARVFGGRDKLYSYDAPIEHTTRKTLAVELQDFADAILSGRRPEVAGEEGLDAVALSYAILESGHVAQPVSFDDVRSDRVNTYQQQINESVGL
jgi:predicted dehydrogenase